jgi:hypothetical protein
VKANDKAAWYFPRFVGIVGVNRVGKDSTGRILVEEFGYKRVALADPLKNLAFALNPIISSGNLRLRDIVTENTVEMWEIAKDIHHGVRQALIDLGNAGRFVFGVDFWVEQAVRLAGDEAAVFTDIRFLNEAAYLSRSASTGLVRVNRPGHEVDDFNREVPRIKVDFEVDNDGELDDLRFKVLDGWHSWLATRTADTLFPTAA